MTSADSLDREDGSESMTRSTVKNLGICGAQFLVTEVFLAGVVYPTWTSYPLLAQICWRLAVPFSLFFAAPLFFHFGDYARFGMFLFIDLAFLSVMAFSIVKNHRA
jgi:hypothetical protein